MIIRNFHLTKIALIGDLFNLIYIRLPYRANTPTIINADNNVSTGPMNQNAKTNYLPIRTRGTTNLTLRTLPDLVI